MGDFFGDSETGLFLCKPETARLRRPDSKTFRHHLFFCNHYLFSIMKTTNQLVPWDFL